MGDEKLHPQVKKCVVLSDAFHLNEPVGFLIFGYESSDTDYYIHYEERDARNCAMEQAEYAWQDMEEGTEMPEWPIYALWPTDWPDGAVAKKVVSAPPPPVEPLSPEEQTAADTRRAWSIMAAIPRKDLVWLLSQVGLKTDIPDISIIKSAVVRWHAGFPPNVDELDRLEKK
jgi:hypothetical protein